MKICCDGYILDTDEAAKKQHHTLTAKYDEYGVPWWEREEVVPPQPIPLYLSPEEKKLIRPNIFDDSLCSSACHGSNSGSQFCLLFMRDRSKASRKDVYLRLPQCLTLV